MHRRIKPPVVAYGKSHPISATGRGEWITRPNLEGGACLPGIETNYFEPEIAEFIHEPWRHLSGLDSHANINSRMPADQNVGLF